MAMFMPILASADDTVEINGIYYNLFSKGNVAEVTANPDKYSGDVVIPKKVKYEGVSYTVRSIGEMAFKQCYDLTSVTIPVGVTSICKEAFYFCTSLTSVTIPEGVTYIEGNAFTECVELASVTIPKSVNKLGSFVFSYCKKLKSVIIPEGVTTIDVGAFKYCSSLSSVTIPTTVTGIHVSAFDGTSLTSVTIPQNVNTIYSKAFGNCKQLKDVYCYAEKMRYVNTDVFEGSYPEFITLHVPAAYMDYYKENEPWSLFNKIVKITGNVKLNKTKVTLEKGKTMTLKATVTPSTLLDKSVIWKSSNTAVATVTSTGQVEGVKAGTATITCTSIVTGTKATCKVTVSYVKLDQTEVTVLKGKTVTLTPTVYPSKLEDKSVTWESSDTKVATVTTAGKVKGVKTGTATITCTSNATGLKATCTVNVVKGIVTLNMTDVCVQKGKTTTLEATVTPSTQEDKSVTWKSSDTKIATVTSKGKVKGVKYGTAIITCTSNATGVSATCKVTVGKVVISLSEFSIKKSRTEVLTATIYPSSLTDKRVTWESSDKTIVTVTSEGKVKGIKAGTATITCTSVATGLKGTCTVTVLSTSGARSLGDDDDETTGLKDVVDPTVIEPFDVYDLSGRKVLNQVTSLDGLANGIYIVNGKKVLKK
jgi:uncharacterized protein YjdB